MFRSFNFGNTFSSSNVFGKIASVAMTSGLGSSSSVMINGKIYRGNNSVEVTDQGVYVDGKLVGSEDTRGRSLEVKIVVEGDTESVETASGPVTVHGNVKGSVKTMSGGVTCGNVTGSVSTMSGSVRAHGTVGGSVSTMSGGISYHQEPPRQILASRVRKTKTNPSLTPASPASPAAPSTIAVDTAPRKMGVKRKMTESTSSGDAKSSKSTSDTSDTKRSRLEK